MDAFQKTNQIKCDKMAGTLPITCQICLGKVCQPVICPNQHVFCSACMDSWLQRIQKCPTCRVAITEPLKPILGGAPLHEAGDNFSNKDMRKTRVELLFKEYEVEILRLEQKVASFSAENDALHRRLKQNLHSTAASESTAVDNAVLKGLTEKLEKMTAQYNNAMQQVEKAKKEKTAVEDKNVDLHRETSRLRLELSTRSPRRFGRSTVSALESRVETYQKQIKQLERALERSDAHIEYLESLLKDKKSSTSSTKAGDMNRDKIEKRQDYTKPGGRSDEAYKKPAQDFDTRRTPTYEDLPSSLSEISAIADEPRTDELRTEEPRTRAETTFDLEMPSPMTNARRREERDDTLEDPTILNVAAIEHAKKRLRFGDKDEDGFEKPPIRDNLNISMTPELENCMRILDEAERKVAETTDKDSELKVSSGAVTSMFSSSSAVTSSNFSSSVAVTSSVFSNPVLMSDLGMKPPYSYSSAGHSNPAQNGAIPKGNPPPYSSLTRENGDLNSRPVIRDPGSVTHAHNEFMSSVGTSRSQDLNSRPRSHDSAAMFSSHDFARSEGMGSLSARDSNPRPKSQDALMFPSRSSHDVPISTSSQSTRPGYWTSLSQDTHTETHFSQDMNPLNPRSQSTLYPQSLSQDTFPAHPPFRLDSNSRPGIPSARSSATTGFTSAPLGSFSLSGTTTTVTTASTSSSLAGAVLGREFESRLSGSSQVSDRGTGGRLSWGSLSQPSSMSLQASSFPSQAGMSTNTLSQLSNRGLSDTPRNPDQLNF